MEKNNNTKKIIIAVSAIVAVAILIIGGILIGRNMESGNLSIGKKDKVEIKPSETKNIQFTDFDNGLIKLKVPERWKVDTLGDYIHYTIKVYDPENPTYQFFLNLKTEGYNKSQEAKDFQQRYYPNSMFAKTSVISEKTTEGFYKIFNDLGTLNNSATFTFPTLTDFTVLDNLGPASIGGDVLRASFKDANGKDAEGIFTAYVYDPGPYYVNEYVMSGKQIDIYYLNVYNTMFISAPKDKLVDWEQTLSTINASLEFTDTFMNQYGNQQDAVMQNFQSVRAICNQTSDIIMSAWESRSAAYDRMSQKQSDATLGYERVYDTDTGEIYKAYNGFTDDYQGNRYQSITDDMYTKPTDGYIERVY